MLWLLAIALRLYQSWSDRLLYCWFAHLLRFHMLRTAAWLSVPYRIFSLISLFFIALSFSHHVLYFGHFP